MKNLNNTNIAQIRLLIPKEWLDELTSLAKGRYMSRLSLIRTYLRNQMDEELRQLEDHFAARERQRATINQLDNWIAEKERCY